MYPSQIAKEQGGTDLGTWPLEYEAWQYYDLNVLRMPNGFYTTTDSGCSCPSPFEDTQWADYKGPKTADEVLELYSNLVVRDDDRGGLTEEDFQRQFEQLKAALA